MFSKSPVKSVVEKINPVSKRGRITSLKFERKADYRTFLRYVNNNTKDLEKLSEKSDDKVDKKGSGLLGGLILLALFGGGVGGSGQKDEGGIDKLSLLNKAIFKAKADDKRFKSQREKTTRLKSIIGANRGIKKLRDFLTNRKNIKLRKLNFAKVKNFAKNLKPNIVKARKVSLSKIRNFARQLKEISTLREARRIEKVQKNVREKVGSNVEGTSGGPTGGTGGRNINKINKTKFFQSELLDDSQGKIGYTSKSEKERFNQLLKDQEKLKKTLKQKANRMDSLLDLSVDKTQIESDKQLELLEQDPEFQKELKKIQNDELEKNLRKLEDPKIKKKRIDFLKFNRRVDRLTKILFPFARFIANPNRYLQFEFIRETIEAKPFADGTLTGVMDIKGRLPGDEGYDESTKGQYVKPVNIFIPSFEGNQSTIPFDTSLPLVTVPKDLQSPSNNIIVDYEFTSSDDLFFMKMAGN